MSPVPAEQRLARILAVVPWVAAADGPTIAEICQRFGLSEAELMADLDLLLFCGVYPFTPDTLIEVDIDDGRVWLRFADYFRRPLRLTPPEALALLSAGAAMLSLPGLPSAGDRPGDEPPDRPGDGPGNRPSDGPRDRPGHEPGDQPREEHGDGREGALGRALAKLEEALGVGRDEALEVTLGPAEPAVLEAVRRASAARRKVAIDYYSFGRDGRSERVVQPWRVFHEAGQWYLEGWCEQAEAQRLFRVDRIISADVLADPSPDPPATAAEIFHPDASDPVVVLDLAPSAAWVAERYPNEGVEAQPDGHLRVRLRAGERAWLERLLLAVGDEADVVEGDPQVRSDAARRVLARYRP